MDTRFNFHQMVEDLQKDILTMGALVESQIRQAVESLASLDEKKLARETIGRDDKVDNMMLEIEEKMSPSDRSAAAYGERSENHRHGFQNHKRP